MTGFAIKSLNIGQPQIIARNGVQVKTSFGKIPVNVPVFLSETGFEGDQQADLENHGGRDKAVCAYPFDHYEKFPQRLFVPAFAENLTVVGGTEDQIYLGETFLLGEALLQVSQPRMPCFKVGVRHGDETMPAFMVKNGFTGFYLRVLQPGLVEPGQSLKRVAKPNHQVTVADVNYYTYHDKTNKEQLNRLVGIAELAEDWRKIFIKRLG